MKPTSKEDLIDKLRQLLEMPCRYELHRYSESRSESFHQGWDAAMFEVQGLLATVEAEDDIEEDINRKF